MNHKKLLLALIKDDLVHHKLLNAFSDLGIRADYYHLRLNETIFELMGFDESRQTDMIVDHYFELLKHTKFINFEHHPRQLDLLTTEIYDYLEMVRENKAVSPS